LGRNFVILGGREHILGKKTRFGEGKALFSIFRAKKILGTEAEFLPNFPERLLLSPPRGRI